MIRKTQAIDNEITAAAIAIRECGFAPVPAVDKHPTVPKWERFASDLPSMAQVERWFRSPQPAVAIVLGDRLVVRDFDTPGAYDAWCACYGHLADILPTVETSPGRAHVYVRPSPGSMEAIRQQYRQAGVGAINLPNGELRFGHAIVMAPPSPHPDGGSYRWLVTLDANVPECDPRDIGFLTANVTQQNQQTQQTQADSSHGGGVFVSLEASIDAAIAATLPPGPKLRNRHIWKFARMLKGIEQLRGVKAKELRPIMRKWHAAALPKIRTKPFDESWIDFVRAWEESLYAIGASLQECFAAALQQPFPACAGDYDTPAMQQLVALCANLQDRVCDVPFFLSTRDAGKLLGVTPMQALRYLHTLESDEVLECVQRGQAAGRKATVYRFTGER